MSENKKASIIMVLKVLEEYSDKNHFLTQKEIADKVYTNYGIQLERKSIASSLSLLEELDYDIVKGPKGGFALYSRFLDESEIKFLIDAIFSSKSIEGKQAKSLCDKISSSLSKYDRKSYEYLIKSTDLNRTSNKNVFLNIEVINEAIKENKWIGFKYLTYDKDGKQVEKFDGYVYHASPCYLVNNYGRYYLLAYRYKYNSVNAWKVDKMSDVYVMDERVRIDPTTLDEFKNYRSISEYLNDHIYLFGGKVIEAEIELKESSSLSYVKEWFGDKAEVFKDNDKLCVRVKCNEEAFFYWIMQYGEHMKLRKPLDMIKKIQKAAEAMQESYKDIK